MRSVSLALVAGLVGGCAVNSASMRPQALGAGNFEAAMEPAVIAGVNSAGVGCCAPLLNASFRWGVGDKTDLGFRVGTTGIRFVSKFQLTDGDTIVSIAPELGGVALVTGYGGGTLVSLQVPVLIGFPIGDRSQFILGPGVSFDNSFVSSAGPAAGLLTISPQLSAGVSAWVSESVNLIPSFLLSVPVVGENSDDGATTVGAAVGGVGIGFQFGILLGRRGRN